MEGSYEEQWAKAEADGATKPISREIFRFENEGDVLLGKVIEIKPFTDGEFDTEVSQYILDTDDGVMSCILGSATDKQIQGKVSVDDVVRFAFKGKTETAKGNQVNVFDVKVRPAPSGDPEPAAPVKRKRKGQSDGEGA